MASDDLAVMEQIKSLPHMDGHYISGTVTKESIEAAESHLKNKKVRHTRYENEWFDMTIGD